ncbi:MAG: alpha/beta hydrolase [Ignavibacteriaceae bacterium]
MKYLLFVLLISLPLLAQDNNPKPPADTSYSPNSEFEKLQKKFPFIKVVVPGVPDNITVKENLVYKDYGERKLHLDLFYADNKTSGSLPVVILIHGGGWRLGNKSLEQAMAVELASNGYIAAAVEYRLSPEAKYPAGVFDLKEAIKWLKKNADEYNIDTNKIAAAGESAGGTLAALLGTTGSMKEFEAADQQGYSSDIHAIVDIDGILDFTHPAESGKDTIPGKSSAGKAWFGASYKENPDLWRSASPFVYAGENTPPVIFINSADERFQAGRDVFIERIKPHNIYYEVHAIPDTPHGFWMFHPWFDQTSEYVITFLDKVLKGKE